MPKIHYKFGSMKSIANYLIHKSNQQNNILCSDLSKKLKIKKNFWSSKLSMWSIITNIYHVVHSALKNGKIVQYKEVGCGLEECQRLPKIDVFEKIFFTPHTSSDFGDTLFEKNFTKTHGF